MIRLFPFIAFVGVFFLPSGCSGDKDKAIWQDVKITELSPVYGPAGSKRELRTIDFDVYIFEMPAEAVTVLDDVWPALSTQPLRFNNQNAFGANLFSAGFGSGSTWDKVGQALRSGGARKIRKVSLYLFEAQANDVIISRVYGKESVFYLAGQGRREQITVGPGRFVLRLKAEGIAGARGVCRVSVVPVFSPSAESSIPQLAERIKAGEAAFEAVGFELRMGPGDFVFLGPMKYVSPQAGLCGRFFSRDDDEPAVRAYLIVFGAIID